LKVCVLQTAVCLSLFLLSQCNVDVQLVKVITFIRCQWREKSPTDRHQARAQAHIMWRTLCFTVTRTITSFTRSCGRRTHRRIGRQHRFEPWLNQAFSSNWYSQVPVQARCCVTLFGTLATLRTRWAAQQVTLHLGSRNRYPCHCSLVFPC